MATYIKGVTDYIPVLEPFKPDYKFLSDVLTVRQDRYDTNFQQLNNLYSKVVYAPLTREDNGQRRDQYANKISNGLKQVSGLDLSLQQNVDVAKGIFKPFFEDKDLIRDMAYTKSYSKQMQLANRLKNDPDSDGYWDIGVQGLQMNLEKFKNAPLEETRSMGLPQYVQNPNLYKKSFDALKESGLKIKQTTLEGDWIVTTQNGTALTNHITGYKRNEDGTLILDDDKQPIPITTNPAADHIQNTVMKDPQVRQAYLLEAQVKAWQFGTENAEKYGSAQNAERAWYKDTIEKYANEETKKLVNDMAVYNNAVKANENWEDWKKRNNVSPGSSAEEALALSAYNLSIAKSNKEATEQRIKDVKQPTDDWNKIKNIAFSSYMGANMAPKMMAAAKAYSLVDAERTLKANPFKQLERQHQFQLNRMAYQHKYDMAKMAQKFIYDSELEMLKNSGGQNVNLFSGVQNKAGNESISGSPMDSYNMFFANDGTEGDQYRKLNETTKQLFDIVGANLPSEFIGYGGYQGNGKYKYTVHNAQYPNGHEVTGSLNDMMGALDPLELTEEFIDDIHENQSGNLSKEQIRQQYEGYNQANIQEVNKIQDGVINMLSTTNPDGGTSPYITLQDGSVVNMNFPTLSQTPEGADLAVKIGLLVESINMQKDMIVNASTEQNRVYKNIHDFILSDALSKGQLSVSTGDSGKEVTRDGAGDYIQEKPGIILTQGMVDMYNKGVMPFQVNFAHNEGRLEEEFKDSNGDPIYRMLGKEEYANMFANIMHGTQQERDKMWAQYNKTGSFDMDTYDFWMREDNAGGGDGVIATVFGDDYEWMRYDYWDFESYNDGSQYMDMEDMPMRPTFDRESAIEDGREFYDDMVKNMRSTSTRPEADGLELTFDRRAFIRGLPEYGDQILENQYVSQYDVASPNAQTIPVMKDLVNVFYNTPEADLRIVAGDMRGTPFGKLKNQENVKKFLDYAFDDLAKGSGMLDKTQSRFFVSDTYVEKAGGPDQDPGEHVAARYLRFSPEFLQERKTFIDKMDKNLFSQLANGVTLMYDEKYDNNPYKSDNQIINQVATIIRNEGAYTSPFIPNGGYFTIYDNSSGQYVAEHYSYGVDTKTGNIVPDKVQAFPIAGIDESQLDALKVTMQQKMYEISLTNLAQQKKIQASLTTQGLEDASN